MGTALATRAALLSLTVGLATPAALLSLTVGLAAARGWSRPTAIVPAAPMQIVGTHAAFSATGQPAVGFAFVDPGRQRDGEAWVALLGADGHPELARRLADAREVLDLAFVGGAFRVLVAAGGGTYCCSVAREVTLDRRGRGWAPGPARTLTRGLAGTVLGSLLGAGRGILAAVADAAELRVIQARDGERFGPVHRLTSAATAPRSLTAAPLAGGGTLLAWISGGFRPADTPAPQTIMLASGTATHVPGPARTLLTLAAGHSASQLALAAGAQPSVAWIEDWSDDTGAYQTAVSVDTPGPGGSAVSFPGNGAVQSGLAAAGDASGEEVIAWSACDGTPACQVMASTRSPSGTFATPVALGAIDAGEEPAVAVASDGAAAVGWISDGRVLLAWRGSAAAPFAPARRLPGLGYAQDVTLLAGSDGRLLAAWSDGLTRRTLEVSVYSPR
jgi:hypothetical protein